MSDDNRYTEASAYPSPAVQSDNPPAVKEPSEELTVDDRIERLEKLAALYFGAHHFEKPAPEFDPDAARNDARARFQRDMEEIEAKAKSTVN